MSEFIEQYGPQIVAMAPSFIVGFIAGKFAKKALTKTLIVCGVGIAVLAGLGVISLDPATIKDWAQSGSAWFDENLEGTGAYLASLLPSATAAAAGAAFGFRGKPAEDGPVKDKVADTAKDGVKGRIRNG